MALVRAGITKQTFDVILADPPWHFKVWNEESGSGRSASKHYPVMSIEEICALPVNELRAGNCALFLWATWPTIFRYVPVVLKAWGFIYRTKAFTWVKTTKNGNLAMGTGYYTRANDEPCLLAVRGSMPVADRGVLGTFLSPRREHSRKPDEQYEMIERLYPDRNYLELFAREKREGWSAWGNEIESDIWRE